MNTIEEFVCKLTKETTNNNIEWVSDNNTELKSTLANSSDIYRIYKTSLKNCSVFFIMQKAKDYSIDFDELYNSTYKYIVIYADNNLSEVTSNDASSQFIEDLYNAINDSINKSIISNIKF